MWKRRSPESFVGGFVQLFRHNELEIVVIHLPNRRLLTFCSLVLRDEPRDGTADCFFRVDTGPRRPNKPILPAECGHAQISTALALLNLWKHPVV